MTFYRRRWIGLGLLLVVTGCQPAGHARLARTVILISLDGATPAGITAANTPHLHELLATGAQSRNAHSVPSYKTLPCHVSMLTGLQQAKHGITQNNFTDPLPVLSVPTVFDCADQAGLDALMLVGKYKLLTLRSGHYAALDQVATVLNRETRYHVPDFVFIHSAEPDATGHAEGWMSPAYLRAIERADAMVGEVVTWVRSKGVWDRTLILISADHGGYGKTHLGDHPEDTVVPWIASGGAVYGRSLPDGLRITDLAPTILYALDLPLPENLDGVPVTALFRTAAASRTPSRHHARAAP
jgi:predicted AlkP superfamily pyrophosphatase or phosphodiesterase